VDAPGEARDQARRILELLPPLRQWVTARVQQAGLDSDLSLRQYAALHGIRDGATSPGELARLWQVTPAVITGIVDRLERRGLLRREPDPDDRRRLRLALTDAGLAVSQEVERVVNDDLAAQLATLSADELASLQRGVDLLHRTFAALQERAPRPAPPPDDDVSDWSEDGASLGPQPLARQKDVRERTRALVGAGT
jgi:DNA-binding MarR family transcriptional regulator